MTETKIQIFAPKDVRAANREMKIAEKLNVLPMLTVDDTVKPEEGGDWFTDFQEAAVFVVKNFRGFKKGDRGRRQDYIGADALAIEIPRIIPLDQVEAVCALLQQKKNAAVEALKQMESK